MALMRCFELWMGSRRLANHNPPGDLLHLPELIIVPEALSDPRFCAVLLLVMLECSGGQVFCCVSWRTGSETPKLLPRPKHLRSGDYLPMHLIILDVRHSSWDDLVLECKRAGDIQEEVARLIEIAECKLHGLNGHRCSQDETDADLGRNRTLHAK